MFWLTLLVVPQCSCLHICQTRERFPVRSLEKNKSLWGCVRKSMWRKTLLNQTGGAICGGDSLWIREQVKVAPLILRSWGHQWIKSLTKAQKKKKKKSFLNLLALRQHANDVKCNACLIMFVKRINTLSCAYREGYMCVAVSWLSPMTFWSLCWLPSNLTMTTRLLIYCTDMWVSSNLTLGNRVNEH